MTFAPEVLGKRLRQRRATGEEHFVSFLLGSGFSRSTGIPTAGEIVASLKAEEHAFLEDAEACPATKAEYAHLMRALGSPRDRAKHVKSYIDRGRDPNSGLLKLNWAHMLLATLVQEKYVKLILTTNFDPLIVEALAMSGLEIRTYDLTATRSFQPGLLDPGTVIYLHGQMHNLLLANTEVEIQRIESLYPTVLQETVRDSTLIVVGYSGGNDPVLKSLAAIPNYPDGVYWSHFSRSESPPAPNVVAINEDHGEDFRICQRMDADEFMVRLVADGAQLALPKVVTDPVGAAADRIRRIGAFPPLEGPPRQDPARAAERLLVDIETRGQLTEPALELAVLFSGLTGNSAVLEDLAKSVEPAPGSSLSEAFGSGYLRLATAKARGGDRDGAEEALQSAERFGVSGESLAWIPLTRGNILGEAALRAHFAEDQRDLFLAAQSQFSNALEIKPDMHEALYNWGTTLADQAKAEADPQEARRLLSLAAEKFAKALEIKPDKHEALNNWGIALAGLLKDEADPQEARRLLSLAAEKFAKALEIEPDNHDTLNNWGIALAGLAKAEADPQEARRLLSLAAETYAKALEIKPDNHDTLYNWAIALADQAKAEADPQEARRLLSLAAEKFAKALELKPDNHDTLNNWAIALADQAKAEADPQEARRLFSLAAEKYAMAREFKPDSHETHFNLACLAALQGEIEGCVAQLERWSELNPQATGLQVDADRDFDRVRDAVEFRAFLDSLKP